MMTATSLHAAAQAAGCSERSLYRWLREPVFAAALDEAQREALGVVQRRLVSLSVAATSALAKVMNDPDAPHHALLRAADIALHRQQTLRELNEIEQRLVEVEQRLNLTENPHA